MAPTYTAKQIAKVVIEHLNDGSTLSRPVPVKKGDRMFLAFFYYTVGVPANGGKIWPPYCLVLVDTESIENIQFTRVESKDFGIDFPSGQPLGKMEDDYLIGITRSEFEAMNEQFYNSVDEMIRAYLKPPSELSAQEKDAVAQFHKLFHILAPKTKSLLPYYRAMNPVFFHWVDEISAG